MWVYSIVFSVLLNQSIIFDRTFNISDLITHQIHLFHLKCLVSNIVLQCNIEEKHKNWDQIKQKPVKRKVLKKLSFLWPTLNSIFQVKNISDIWKMNNSSNSEENWCPNVTENDNKTNNMTVEDLCDEICQVWRSWRTCLTSSCYATVSRFFKSSFHIIIT